MRDCICHLFVLIRQVADASHSSSVRFHPVDLRLHQMVSGSSWGQLWRPATFSMEGMVMMIWLVTAALRLPQWRCWQWHPPSRQWTRHLDRWRWGWCLLWRLWLEHLWNELDGEIVKLYFRSDQWAENWLYGSAHNSPSGEKADKIENSSSINLRPRCWDPSWAMGSWSRQQVGRNAQQHRHLRLRSPRSSMSETTSIWGRSLPWPKASSKPTRRGLRTATWLWLTEGNSSAIRTMRSLRAECGRTPTWILHLSMPSWSSGIQSGHWWAWSAKIQIYACQDLLEVSTGIIHRKMARSIVNKVLQLNEEFKMWKECYL